MHTLYIHVDTTGRIIDVGGDRWHSKDRTETFDSITELVERLRVLLPMMETNAIYTPQESE